MRLRTDIISCLGAVFLLLNTFSCADDKESVARVENGIVINEIMPSNRTGLLTEKGKAADWIELKNTSADTIDLKGFKLAVIVPDSVADAKAEEDEDIADEETSWTFPELKIPGGECMVIFADKKKKSKPQQGLVADLKLPKGGATLRLLSPGGKVLKELTYSKAQADHSWALQPDSSYRSTFWQSPGFENDRAGYEAASKKMDAQRKSPLLIWEVMARAKHSYENWVELKNVGNTDIDLAEYTLSKKKSKTDTWNLPKRILKPGEIITFQLAGSRANRYNSSQVPFRLGDSETIILSKDGKFVDGVCAKASPVGGSIGRRNGEKGFFLFSNPTRNEENGDDGRRFIAPDPEFDHKPGTYPGTNELTLRLKDKSRVVRYTTNGSEPTSSSPVFPDSMVITKGTVIRSFAEGDSLNLRSNLAAATFLPGTRHTVPVMNIAVNHSDLYDYNRGIYADGPEYGEEWPHPKANFWKNWTKNAHVEFFDEKDREGFAVACGLKIFGGYSRNEPKKSFRLKFRHQFGDSEVDYDFFDNGQPVALKDLVLRSGSQDYNRCMVRDEFFTSLMQANSPTLLTQAYRPVALYVNGDYFGLYFLREKIDKNFVARKLNIPNDSINIIMSKGYNEEGGKTAYFDMIKYVSNHDMREKANFDYVAKNMDLQGLIDYKLGEIYSGNTDVGNIRYVRSTSPESDKKWHFIFYDLDATWIGYKPGADYYLSTGGAAADAYVTHHNIVINRLLANKEFRAMFLERLSYHLANTFSEKNATEVFDRLVERIRPEMQLNCQRWPQLSYKQWEKNVADFKVKFKNKPKIMLDDLRKYLSITPEEEKKYFSSLGY